MKNKGNKTKHLCFEERYVIEKMLKKGKKQKEIAFVLERSEPCISKEIKRGVVMDKYIAKKAHQKAYVRQYLKKKDCLAVSMNKEIYNYVEDHIKKGWSPDMISIKLKGSENYASSKAIYKFLSKRRPDLERHLFWRRNNKKSGLKRGKQSFLQLRNRKSILDRDLVFPKLKSQFGHYEMDFIVSKHSKDVLLVLVEKLTKYTEIVLLKKRNNRLVNQAIISLLKNKVVKSITTDNDIAFSKYKYLENRLNTSIFFTDPYCSWQKGLVENTNRWIRQFVPKKTNLAKLSNEYVGDIQDWLNSLPKLVLGGSIASEEFFFQENGVRISSLLVSFPKRIG